jgi:hypothetical protein
MPPERYGSLQGKKSPVRRFFGVLHAKCDKLPGAEGLREGPLFTAVFADIDESAKEPAVIDFHISPENISQNPVYIIDILCHIC